MSAPIPGAAWKQPDQAAAFIDDYRPLIPMLEGQEDLIRRLLRGGRKISRFLDLGAGAGGLAQLVMELHPGSSGVLVDFSEPMIAAGHQRLGGSAGRWQYVQIGRASCRERV
jgi:SAM-dependent methyltransferase